jgi:hypothetical protein
MAFISAFKVASLSKKFVVTSAVAWMTTSNTVAMQVVLPERMMPSSTMKSMNWKDATLIPIDLTIGVQEQSPSLSGDQVLAKEGGSIGSIAFVVRRPGWVLCREHGLQLAAAKRDTNQLEGFNLFGIIKETGRVRLQ